jgi:hypothetical protein
MCEGNENLFYPSPWDFKSSLTCHKILRHGTFQLYFPSERNMCCGSSLPLKVHSLGWVWTCNLWVQWQAHWPLHQQDMLKIRWRISDTYTQISHPFDHSSYSLPDASADRIARELWWTSHEYSPSGINITVALHAHTSPGGWAIGPLLAAVLRRKSHPIGMINQ